MKKILATVIVASALGCATTRGTATVEAGKVYNGTSGESVAVVPLKDASDGVKFLLYVQGTDSVFDGKALPHELNAWNDNANENYHTQYEGRDFNTLVSRESRGSKNIELYVPNKRNKGIAVFFDAQASQALKGKDIYSLYLKQQKDGTLTKLSAFDRPANVAEQDKGFTAELAALNKQCGTSVTASIDWNTIPDELLKRYSITSYCSGPLNALQKLCDGSPVSQKVIRAKVKQVSCQFGPEMKLEVQDGAVKWTTAQDASNQEEFAKAYFEKNL
ncbi:hypothetical protein [Stigmatella aurantiaca]|uniref:Conserved uncharacterized protein n=1 Tax=Stigmatella aurantiaca (strain DW4/3-1) TaxID=378806 RepID=Q08RU2_STIAD|nr:hypothetical protein [Stigmatella aurantiaca]ADO68262.1 conserved uncharacterized protein [Stigmatella aurantiaca DW4/3-1]EAU63198.1 hypothetical protein STIAU_1755 [Stigmatella aurantiaca DW4/3-1]